MDVVEVAGVRFDFHVHELLDHCGRRVEAAVVAVVEGRVQQTERSQRQLV